MGTELRILMLEDHPEDAELIIREIKKEGIVFSHHRVSNKRDFLKALQEIEADIILVDYLLPDINGLEAVKIVRSQFPLMPLIVVTGSINEETAVECIKSGADDYVLKENIVRLGTAISNAIQKHKIHEEKENAFRELTISEIRYRKFFELDFTGNYISNPEGELLDCNPRFLKIFGFKNFEEAKKTNLSILYSDPATREHVLSQLRSKKNLENYELRLRDINGNGIYVIANMIGEFDEAGNLSQTRGYLVDLSERKKAEEKLLKSEQQYRTIFEYAPVGIYQVDRDGKILKANQNLARILGYDSVDELIQKRMGPDIYFDPVEREQVITQYEPGGKVLNIELKWKKRDGTPIWILLSCHYVKVQDSDSMYFEGFVQDITEKKKAEEILHENEKRNSLLWEASKDAIILIDEEGNIHFTNPAVKTLFNYEPHELINQNIRILKPGLTKSDILPLSELLNPKFPTRELLLEGKNGIKNPVDISLSTIHWSGKNLYVGFIRDISERKRIQEEINRNQQKQLLHVQQTPLGVIEWNANLEIIDWNPAAERIFGYKKEEIFGKPASILVLTESKEQVADIGKKLLNEKGGQRSTNSNRTKDGRTIICEWYNTPLKDSEGNIIGIASLVEDITVRKKAEQAIKESEQKYRSLIETAGTIIIGLNPEGKIFEWNLEAERVYGYSKEEVMFHDYHELFKPDDLSQVLSSEIQNVLEDGPARDFENTIITRDGQKYVILWNITRLLSFDQEPIGVIAIGQDITERKKAEEALIVAKKEAEAANHAKSDFLANMSHEIRTPMNAIMGFTYLLMETRLDEEQKDYLTKVKESSDALLTIINDILDFSKIEARKLEFQSIEFNLHKGIFDVVKSLNVDAHRNRINLFCTMQGKVPVHVLGDPNRLRQVILNLTGNAIKFTKDGEVNVGLEVKEKTAEHVLIHVFVKDTGIGISEDKQKLIFSPFTQVDMSSTRRYGGTGLGLTIAKLLVEKMDGELWVESEFGKGSTFHFTAKFILSQRESDTAGIENKEFEGKQILFLSADKKSKTHYSELLKDLDITAEIQNIDYLSDPSRSLENDLIIIDFSNAEEEVFKALNKKELINQAAKVLLFCDTVDVNNKIEKFKKLGYLYYSIKPVLPYELKEQLKNIFSQRNSYSMNAQSQQIDAVKPAVKLNKHILLAEDNYFNRVLAIKILQNFGYTVTAVENGKEALAALGKNHFDLILMDIQMPEMDGFEASKQIRVNENGTSSHIPIIAMTAFAMKGDKERCLSAGMDGYISKPIDQMELSKMLHEFLLVNN